jgi:hypothetical protein
MLDNIDVAILTRLNELAERHGLRPCDFVATVVHDADSGRAALQFEVPAQGNALREQRFEKMLQTLGVDSNGRLTGGQAKILDALDNALQTTPKPRTRF